MPAPALKPVFRYVVDAFDRICYVSPEWEDFALENATPCLAGGQAIGRPLMDFITDPSTQEIYRLILEHVRRDRLPTVVPFRCDSPALRRFMELRISPARGDEVQFEGCLLRLEPRDPVPLLEPAVPRSSEFVTICGWCKRVRVHTAWLEVESAVERLGLFNRSPLPQLTHGICGECAERANRELAAHGA